MGGPSDWEVECKAKNLRRKLNLSDETLNTRQERKLYKCPKINVVSGEV